MALPSSGPLGDYPYSDQGPPSAQNVSQYCRQVHQSCTRQHRIKDMLKNLNDGKNGLAKTGALSPLQKVLPGKKKVVFT